MTSTQPAGGVAALAEPTARVRPGWVAWLFAANVGLWFAFLTPIQVLLPRQAELLDAGNKMVIFNVVTGAGAVVAIIVTPVAGHLSDHTTSRFGRRHPWTVGGALGALAGFTVLALAGNVVLMTVGWCLAQASLNCALAALTAALPDRVPVAQRAEVAGVIGITQILGVLAGIGLVTALLSGVAGGYLACAAAVIAGALLFAWRTPDTVLPRASRPGRSFGELVREMWVSPRAHPDFAWAWCGHFCTQLGNALGLFYMLFFLTDVVRLPNPEGALLMATGLYGGTVIIAAAVTGKLSDASGRRKPFVYVAVTLMGAASGLLAVLHTWSAVVTGALLLGTGFGIYAAVGLALLTQVLPDASARAKDLGIVNISQSAPQVLTPLIAGLALLGGYRTLYLVSAAVTLAAGGLIARVRSVR
ncbi:MFS transporter [Amycolatopsis anabasis]|uniref:MFS transporter n=1 Tax=Amycolatopsis anabasis TaxID=1840409 RepID=UPI00131C1045|nr:MFS transporter [Amycolatopsis anabasis]